MSRYIYISEEYYESKEVLYFKTEGVDVNSHHIARKGSRIGPILEHTMYYRCMNGLFYSSFRKGKTFTENE
jgi:hypothetical protein